MRYLSVCSGMEAATVAWHPLGWKPVGFSEIEPFPCAILKHRFPDTSNHGSLTDYAQWPIERGAIDLLVGGTPCQSFSVAGLRKGLEDPRGNLALVFLGLADKLKPRWIVWENVPGVLSSNGGRDFGSFLGALVQLGYGFAYRVLDAQHFGVPQRRRRVFVVACLGDWRAPAEVLLESDCVRRDPKKGRAKGQGVAAGAEGGVGADHPAGCWWDGGQVINNFDLGDTRTTHAVVEPFVWTQNQREEVRILGDKTGALALPGTHQTNYIAEQIAHCSDVAPTVTSSGPPYSRTTHAVVEPIDPKIVQASELRLRGQITEKDICPTLTAGAKQGDTDPLAVHPVAFQPGNLRRQAGADPSTETFPTLKCDAGDQSPHVAGHPPMAVRRLTPVECERLQGFPDNWSRIPWKGKPEEDCPDGPRYKAAGNSMAVPVMRWIGARIAAVEARNTSAHEHQAD